MTTRSSGVAGGKLASNILQKFNFSFKTALTPTMVLLFLSYVYFLELNHARFLNTVYSQLGLVQLFSKALTCAVYYRKAQVTIYWFSGEGNALQGYEGSHRGA